MMMNKQHQRDCKHNLMKELCKKIGVGSSGRAAAKEQRVSNQSISPEQQENARESLILTGPATATYIKTRSGSHIA
jgi:hypothetical protein